MLNGIDISHHQGVIDWQKMAAQRDAGKLDFVIIRAGSIDNVTGNCYEDYQFDNNIAGAKSIDIPYSLYWFFRPNHSAAKQAEYFLSLARGNLCEQVMIDLWCDIEVAGRADVVKAFCQLLDREPVTVGIYTNPNTALYLLTGDKTWMDAYDLWLADWTAPANVPAPWDEWLVWQHAVLKDGAEYGCKSVSLDHNYAQDDFVLFTTPEPPDAELEPRVVALEIAREDHDNNIGLLLAEMIIVKNRLAKLEAENTAQGVRFTIGGSRANLRWYKDTDKADKPIMIIREPRVQYEPGAVIRVDPAPVVATGGERYYKVMGFSNPDLFVREKDGGLQA